MRRRENDPSKRIETEMGDPRLSVSARKQRKEEEALARCGTARHSGARLLGGAGADVFGSVNNTEGASFPERTSSRFQPISTAAVIENRS